MENQFIETRNMFRCYTHYSNPLSFEEWVSVPADLKAAVLYVQFFAQIQTAWYKARSFYGDECEGVSTVMQYLIKNVPIIESNPKRFTANYIYRVAYNCLYCICHDRKCDKERFENETSNIVVYDGDELDLFDTIEQDEDVVDDLTRKEIAAIIATLDDDQIKLVEHIMYTPDKKLSKRLASKESEILKELKVIFADFAKML